MNLSDIFHKFKIGDTLIIESRPSCWSSGAGGNCGVNNIKYPYHLTIENTYLNTNPQTYHIAIRDTNGYGWSINKDSIKLFTQISRASRIKNLNL